MSDENQLVLMDRQRVNRALKRMAYQVAEDNRANRKICLVGIKERGLITARMLASCLAEIYGELPPVINLKLNGDHTDNLFSGLDIDETYLLVVDDVIFSGETMFESLNAIYGMEPFSEIHSAVLVDRGHRKFPIQAQFNGLEYSTKLKEHVSVVTSNDAIEKVVVGIN